MEETCARDGCDRQIPKVALLAGDPYCSSTCCRIVNGLDPAKEREFAYRNKKCSGCDCEMDHFTPDCKACKQRHANRVKAGTARAA